MRIAFFGTPEFAVPSLETLIDLRESVVLVVTQPDRPRGRSRSNVEPSPVKSRAESLVLPVAQPDRPSTDEFAATLAAAKPDLGVVVAYGHILKPAILAIPPLGMINVHASLLPAWRGAAPIQWSIAHGDTVTGVTIMRMEAGLDSGPILLTSETAIGPDDSGGQLTKRLARLGAQALREALELIRSGQATFTPQDHSRATIAPKIGREVARIDWTRPAGDVANRIRAFDPVPGAWSTRGDLQLKCFKPKVVADGGEPGVVLAAETGLVVAAGSGAVAIGEVQPSGRSRMAAKEWLKGRPLTRGDRLR
jgi:methionyl-tRNA formyltransferase